MESGMDFLCCVGLGESLRGESDWVAGDSDSDDQEAKTLPEWCPNSQCASGKVHPVSMC